MNKFINKIIICILVFIAHFNGQQNSYSQALSDSCLAEFYPLNTGDYWEYLYKGTFEVLVEKKVVGDTMMSNGNSYKIIEEFWHGYNELILRYQRYDSSTVFTFDPRSNKELVSYELAKAVGEFWPTGNKGLCDTTLIARIEWIRERIFWGELRTEIEICSYCARDTGLWLCDKLVKGIGPYELDGEGDYLILQGAIINGKEYGTITSVKDPKRESINYDTFLSVYPNPFNQETTVAVLISVSQKLSVKIYDLRGRLVKTLLNGYKLPGEYFLKWDGINSKGISVASGIYLVHLKGDNIYQSKKISLIK